MYHSSQDVPRSILLTYKDEMSGHGES
jgi:hypothetical protein